MNPVPRQMRALLLPLLTLPFLVGCPERPQKKEQTEVLPFAGQEIRIGVPEGMGFPTAWEGPLHEWCAQTGASARLSELPAGTSDGPPVLANEDPPTLAIFPLDEAGPLLAAGRLAPIPEALRGGNENSVHCNDLFAGLREKLVAKKGDRLVPIACPVLVCYYRDDLLRAAKLAPPQTWDDYQELVEKLGDWAPGLVAVEPWGEEFCATMFLARAVAFAQHPGNYSLFFDIETGQPLIDGPGFARALEASRLAIARMPADVLTYQPSDCRAAIVAGRAALAIAFELPASKDAGNPADANAPAGRPGGASYGFVRLPGARQVYNAGRHAWEPVKDKGTNHVSLVGFAGLAAAASSRAAPGDVEAAWNAFIRLAGRDVVWGIPSGVGLCRESQLQDPSAFTGADLSGTEAAAYAQAVADSLRDPRVVLELPVSGRSEFRRVLTKALRGALDGSRSPAESLHEAADGWRAIVEKIGAERLRDQYRSNLGLGPLRTRPPRS